VKISLGAFAVVAALAAVSTPAIATSSHGTVAAASSAATSQAVSDAEFSAQRRHWRRHRYVRPYPHAHASPYGYYRHRPHYYRPYGYYSPGPSFSFGFGPRYTW
jgi:hypothetical protein